MLRVNTKNFGAVVVLCVSGRIVLAETAALLDAALSQSGIGTLVLDLASVDLIDASGFGVMLQLRAETEIKGVNFKLMNLTKRVRQLLEITRLDSVFEVTSILKGTQHRSVLRPSSVREYATCA